MARLDTKTRSMTATPVHHPALAVASGFVNSQLLLRPNSLPCSLLAQEIVPFLPARSVAECAGGRSNGRR